MLSAPSSLLFEFHALVALSFSPCLASSHSFFLLPVLLFSLFSLVSLLSVSLSFISNFIHYSQPFFCRICLLYSNQSPTRSLLSSPPCVRSSTSFLLPVRPSLWPRLPTRSTTPRVATPSRLVRPLRSAGSPPARVPSP